MEYLDYVGFVIDLYLVIDIYESTYYHIPMERFWVLILIVTVPNSMVYLRIKTLGMLCRR
jgi:hypothetical protein